MSKKTIPSKGSSAIGTPVLLIEALAYFVEKGHTADRALNEIFKKYKITNYIWKQYLIKL